VLFVELSGGEARAVGIGLGLIVGLILVVWILALLWPAFNGAGMRGMAAVSTNLTGMLATAGGGQWATKPILSSLDYSRILPPYILTVAIIFFTSGFLLLAWIAVIHAKHPRTA
jgi:hypothetical protein